MIEKGIEKEACDWCSPTRLVYTRVGHFRDFDSDFFYGIGICPGCGGTGAIYETEDFTQRIEQIRELSEAYCPKGGEGARSDIRFEKLRALIKEVTELHKKYGEEGTECFAKDIAEGKLKPLVDRLYKSVQRVAENPN